MGSFENWRRSTGDEALGEMKVDPEARESRMRMGGELVRSAGRRNGKLRRVGEGFCRGPGDQWF